VSRIAFGVRALSMTCPGRRHYFLAEVASERLTDPAASALEVVLTVGVERHLPLVGSSVMPRGERAAGVGEPFQMNGETVRRPAAKSGCLALG